MDDVRAGCQISSQVNLFALIHNFCHVRINSLVRIIPWTIDCRITTVAFRYKTAEPRYNHPEIPPPDPFLVVSKGQPLSLFRLDAVFICCVWVTEQTAIISLYSINSLVCVTERESVYCAVQIGALNMVQINLGFCRVIVLTVYLMTLPVLLRQLLL